MDNFEATYGLNKETETYDYVTGQGLVFYGAGAKYLESKFITPGCAGQSAEVSCSVYIDCCSRWFEFTILFEGIEYCPDDCSFAVDLQRITAQTRAYRYLRNTIYWKNGFVDAFTHPKVYYCNQPGVMFYLMLSLFYTLVPLILVIMVIVDIVKLLCRIVTIGSGRCDLGIAEDINICTFYELIGGCGRYTPSPLIREILEFNATAAGLTLRSSIFQSSVYANMALFQMQYERGIREGDWIEGNAANLTTTQLLDYLSDHMGIDYRIVGTELVVEREDYFDTLVTTLGAVEGCFTSSGEDACAYGEFKYADDSTDSQGNRLRSNYDDIIEFNPNGELWMSGSCEIQSRFGRARFMFDQRGFDRPDDVAGGDTEPLGDNFIDRFRSGRLVVFRQITGLFGCADDRRDRDLILSGNTASALKLLVLEPGFNREDAAVIRREIGRDNGLTFWAYNYPMYFREDEPDGLYQNFLFIRNPNNSGRIMYEISQATLPFSCDMVEAIENAQAGYAVSTALGAGIAEEVDIDFGEQKITLKNIKIRC